MNAIDSALARGLDTKAVIIGQDVLKETGTLFTQLFPGESAVIVADQNTWRVAGPQVAASLIDAGVASDEPIIYPGTPTLFADNHLVDDLTAKLAATPAIAVSIASGSLNDVTKLSSFRTGKSYINVCTAASVDGYTSFGAAITVDGVKGTQECSAPRGVIVPLDIMVAAPTRLTATGYGDLLEKIPAGADWIIADELGKDPIDDYVWTLVQGPLREALSDPKGLVRGDMAAMEKLSDELIMSGLAMQVISSSRPASGAGHYFSHQWEMEGLGRDWEPPLSHGFKVGLGTLSMCALYDQLLALDVSHLDIPSRLSMWPTEDEDQARVAALQPNRVIRASCLGVCREKYIPRDKAETWLRTIKDRWPTIHMRVSAQVLPARAIEQMLREVGAVHHPGQIGLSLEDLRQAYYRAQTIRARYTSVDLLQEIGQLNTLVERLFAPGGYWYERGEKDY